MFLKNHHNFPGMFFSLQRVVAVDFVPWCVLVVRPEGKLKPKQSNMGIPLCVWMNITPDENYVFDVVSKHISSCLFVSCNLIPRKCKKHVSNSMICFHMKPDLDCVRIAASRRSKTINNFVNHVTFTVAQTSECQFEHLLDIHMKRNSILCIHKAEMIPLSASFVKHSKQEQQCLHLERRCSRNQHIPKQFPFYLKLELSLVVSSSEKY